ncbi:hypothetical protein [Legionella jamestowniensis]|nr:hypothetical protein [Legionella jamestowniensis]SFL51779.1 hypothetical protein SAMN02746073_0622 [Legionella jamestowniensis DSM 19215]
MDNKEKPYNPQKSGQTLGRNEQQKMGHNQANTEPKKNKASKIGRKKGV